MTFKSLVGFQTKNFVMALSKMLSNTYKMIFELKLWIIRHLKSTCTKKQFCLEAWNINHF